MTRGSRRLLAVFVIGALPLPAVALAEPKGGAPSAATTATATAPPPEPLTEDQQKAQQHFQRAKELYAAGSYREAAAELEAARGLDPKAKDLVYNLGIVHEKLAKYDEAIAFFRQYEEMDGVTGAEKQKAESIIKRIEGAKRERESAPAPSGSAAAARDATAPKAPSRDETESPPRGRIDALTIGAAAAAVVGAGVGVVFGIRALTLRPSGFVTGKDGTYDDLKSRTSDAHTSAVVADVGFALGVAGAVAAAYFYFGRAKDPEPTVRPAAAPTPGGAVVGLGGSFR